HQVDPAQLGELAIPGRVAAHERGRACAGVALLDVQEACEMGDVRVLGADQADAQHCSVPLVLPGGPGSVPARGRIVRRVLPASPSLDCNRLHVKCWTPWILGDFLGSMPGATACWHCCRTDRTSEGHVMAHPIGIGLLGLGTIGASHARALHALRDRAQVLAYSGGTPERAAEAGWPAAE